jgi:hypothetical protein
VVPTLPLHPRNRLAALILAALGDGEARCALHALAWGDRDPSIWMQEHSMSAAGAGDAMVARLRERARRADEALAGLPLVPDTGLDDALAAAGALFDAGLGFEVHELLEPHWAAATGEAREALQGLIQVAVGYQHLANGNLGGARSLLAEGAARLEHGRLRGCALRDFAAAVRDTMSSISPTDASSPPGGGPGDLTGVPPFPRPTPRSAA